MDAIETLRLDAQAGRISADRLIDLIASQQQLLQSTQQQLQAAQIRIEELEKQVGGSATAKVEEPFSLRAEEPRQAARGKKRKRRPKVAVYSLRTNVPPETLAVSLVAHRC